MNAPLTKREEITQLEAEIAAKNNHLKALVIEINHSPGEYAYPGATQG